MFVHFLFFAYDAKHSLFISVVCKYVAVEWPLGDIERCTTTYTWPRTFNGIERSGYLSTGEYCHQLLRGGGGGRCFPLLFFHFIFAVPIQDVYTHTQIISHLVQVISTLIDLAKRESEMEWLCHVKNLIRNSLDFDLFKLVLRFATKISTITPSTHHSFFHFCICRWLAASPSTHAPITFASISCFLVYRRVYTLNTCNLCGRPTNERKRNVLCVTMQISQAKWFAK